MMRMLVRVALLAAVAAVVKATWPDARRYMNIRKM